MEAIPPRPMPAREIDYIEAMCQSYLGCEWWALANLRRVLRDLIAHIRYLETGKWT